MIQQDDQGKCSSQAINNLSEGDKKNLLKDISEHANVT